MNENFSQEVKVLNINPAEEGNQGGRRGGKGKEPGIEMGTIVFSVFTTMSK